MEIKEIIDGVMSSPAYKGWDKKEHHKLAHVFKMVEDPGWQVGFVSGENIVTFTLSGADVAMGEPQEVFKKPGDKVAELAIDKVKIDWKEALEKAKEFQQGEYPNEFIFKTFFILQTLGEPVYNITMVTKTFKTLNIRVSAETKEVVSHKSDSLLDLGKITK